MLMVSLERLVDRCQPEKRFYPCFTIYYVDIRAYMREYAHISTSFRMGIPNVHCVVEIRITYLRDCSCSTELPFYHLRVNFYRKQKVLGTLGTAPLLWSGIAGTSNLILEIQMKFQKHFLQLASFYQLWKCMFYRQVRTRFTTFVKTCRRNLRQNSD